MAELYPPPERGGGQEPLPYTPPPTPGSTRTRNIVVAVIAILVVVCCVCLILTYLAGRWLWINGDNILNSLGIYYQIIPYWFH